MGDPSRSDRSLADRTLRADENGNSIRIGETSGDCLNVLLVGADPRNAYLIREMLAEARDVQIELDHAQELPSGLDYLAAGDTDVLLLDLPRTGDRDSEGHLSLQAQTRGVPIVVLADLGDKAIMARAQELHAQDYLVWGQLDSRTLLRSMRYAIERGQAEEQLRHSQQLASLGEMAAGIAHEIGNSLANILLYSRLLAPDGVPPQTRKDIGVICSEAGRAARLIKDLMSYARRPKPRMRRLDLHKILRKVLDMRRHQEEASNISMSTGFRDGPLYVKGSSSQLMQVFMNLSLNAEQALSASGGGKIMVTTEADEQWAMVSIADSGTGIPADSLSQVFSPFFTTRRAGRGTGLGLSTCYGLVIAHGGRIRAENNEMGGATFIVELPLAK